MDTKRRQPLGVELVKRGIVGERDIENALRYQRDNPNKRLGDILYLLNAAEPNILIEAIGEIIGEKGILLTPEKIKVRVMDYFSLDIAKQNKVVPFEVANRKN